MRSFKDRRAVHKMVVMEHGPTHEYLARKQALHEMIVADDTYFSTIPRDIYYIILQYHVDPRVVLQSMVDNVTKSLLGFLEQFSKDDDLILDQKKLNNLYDWPPLPSGANIYVKYAGPYAIFVTEHRVRVRIYRMIQIGSDRIRYLHHSSYDFSRISSVDSSISYCPGKYGVEFRVVITFGPQRVQTLRIWPEVLAAELSDHMFADPPQSWLPCGLGHDPCGTCENEPNLVDDYGSHFATVMCLLQYTAKAVQFRIA